MLQRLTLQNFKLFDETGIVIEPGKITVLIGVNGSGKSSLLQALLLLKQSLNSSYLLLTGSLISLGTYKDIAHNQDVTLPMRMGLSVPYRGFDVSQYADIRPSLPSSGVFEYQVTSAQGTIEQAATVGGATGAKLHASYPLSSPASTPGQVIITTAEGTVEAGLAVTPSLGCPFSLNIPAQALAPQTRAILDKVNTLLSTVCVQFTHFYFVPAIRGFDSLSYDLSSTTHADDLTAVGGPEEQAALVANTMSAEPDYMDDVTARLKTILDDRGRLRYRTEQGRLVSEMKSGRTSVNLVNEAFGLNQLIAPLLWLNKTPAGAIVGIEEPEIHLHPRAQAALCDVFVDVATREDKQLMLTTHSEHILMSLLTAVADGRLKPEDLAVYEFRREGGVARAERLAVNEYGQIAGGLKGFLEADLDEIGALIEARFR